MSALPKIATRELIFYSPGSTVGKTTTESSLSLIAECINRAHKETRGVTVVLENMVRHPNTPGIPCSPISHPFLKAGGDIIGSEFSHLAGIIKLVEDKAGLAYV